MIVVQTSTDQRLGYVQATIPQAGGPTEIAWTIGLPWQGQGYASEAAQLLKDVLQDRGVTHLTARTSTRPI